MDDCWPWWGAIGSNGYGTATSDGFRVPAHRFVYERLVGPIPEGLVLDHLCRVRHCVNPRHLEPVANAENVRRGMPFRQPRRSPSPAALEGHTYVGTHEIAVFLGVSQQRVSQLAKSADFPPMFQRLAAGDVWLASEVEAWAKKTGRTIHDD